MLEWLKELFAPLISVVTLPNLAVLSFIEAIFFPIPPDTLLMPLVLRNPQIALWAATITTLASVAGAVVGYTIGLRGGRPLLLRFASGPRLEQVERLYRRYDMWAIFMAAFTPIPYKVFALSAGVFDLTLGRFVVASLIGRFSRFAFVAFLVAAYGAEMVAFVERYFEELTLVVAAAAFAAWWIWRRYAPGRAGGGAA